MTTPHPSDTGPARDTNLADLRDQLKKMLETPTQTLDTTGKQVEYVKAGPLQEILDGLNAELDKTQTRVIARGLGLVTADPYLTN